MREKIAKIIRRIKNEKIARLLVNMFIINSKNVQEAEEIAEKCSNDVSSEKFGKLIEDMIFCRYYLGFKFEEYFYFDLASKTPAQRHEYVGTYERYDCWKDLSPQSVQQKFDNKFTAYQLFKPYYAREIICVESEKDFDSFCDFCSRHDSYMVKPRDFSLGQGIYVVDLDDTEKTSRQLFDDIISSGAAVVEELIYQSFEMALLHPQSVNTVRFATYYNGAKAEHLYAMLRMGCGDTVIDNAFCGGIAAPIDVESGVVSGRGHRFVRGEHQYFDVHPETHAKILGFSLPDWNDLLTLVDELAKVVPEQKIVGWDLAHTADGWVVVEGNSRPVLKEIQMCSGHGLRAEFEKTKG